MKLVRTTTRQAARTMAVSTRRGDMWYVAGSKCDTYEVTRAIDAATGELIYPCSCPDYSEWRRSVSMREEGICKHGMIVRERYADE